MAKSTHSTERRSFLRCVMQTAWHAYRNRQTAGSDIRTFADALRNAWRFLKAKAQPVVQGSHLRMRSMLHSPIRRSLTGDAGKAGPMPDGAGGRVTVAPLEDAMATARRRADSRSEGRATAAAV